MPASNYYVLTAAIVTAFFFLVWGILHDGREETPWVTAGIGASILMVIAVFLREVILRNARNRFLENQRMLDRTLKSTVLTAGMNRPAPKLSMEQNAAIVRAIRKKSEAAQLFANLSDGHREVSDMCREYLLLNASEIARAAAGSPRIPAFRHSREVISGLHRLHLLQWAEIEARSLTGEARTRAKTADKIETAQKALDVVESALQEYPDELALSESESAIREFILSIKVGDWIERAERAAFKGNYKRAQDLYQDALYYLNRENLASNESAAAAERISDEIEKLKKLNA